MNKPERMPGYYDWHEATEYAISQGFKRETVEDIWSYLCSYDPPANGSVFSIFLLSESEDLEPECTVLLNWLLDEFDEEFFVSW